MEPKFFNGINGVIAGFRQLPGQAGANNAGAVHAQDGIHHGREMSIQHIQQAICYMEQHICEPIQYADVAESVHMSNYNFGHAAAVILDTAHALFHRAAGGNGSQEEQDVLALQHPRSHEKRR